MLIKLINIVQHLGLSLINASYNIYVLLNPRKQSQRKVCPLIWHLLLIKIVPREQKERRNCYRVLQEVVKCHIPIWSRLLHYKYRALYLFDRNHQTEIEHFLAHEWSKMVSASCPSRWQSRFALIPCFTALPHLQPTLPLPSAHLLFTCQKWFPIYFQ